MYQEDGMDRSGRVDSVDSAEGIGPALREAYERDGAVLLRGHFKTWVDCLRRGVEKNQNEPGEYAEDVLAAVGCSGFFTDYCNWNRIPEYRSFVMDSPAAAIAAALTGATRVQIFHEHVLIKEPGVSKETIWHQDQPYFCVDGEQGVSIWLVLDHVPLEATLRFVAGSHTWKRQFMPRLFHNGSPYPYEDGVYESVPDIDGEANNYSILAWELEPGDAVAFHFKTLHGARGNLSAGRRRAFSTRWIGDDVRYVKRPGRTSPPYPNIGLDEGAPMREDWFPVVWPRDRRANP